MEEQAQVAEAAHQSELETGPTDDEFEPELGNAEKGKGGGFIDQNGDL
ncbi:MAG: hypothetical protein L0227_14880 [Chloroflexi bacterium]|nr:hypothetical protein [Chloroflexota bacterium]